MTTPPLAPKRPHTHREHGIERDDPWYWLRDRDDAAVQVYLDQENAHTSEVLAPLEPLRKELFGEMLARIQEDDASHPVPDGPWAYFTRTYAGKAYPAYCRIPRDGGDEQVVLDVNDLAEGHEFVSVAMVEVSPDHRILAYAIDTSGREIYEIRFLDLETGTLLPHRIPRATPQLEWAPDNRTVFWVAMDEALRSDRVFRRTIDSTTDELVFHEEDGRFRVWVGKTRSEQFLIYGSGSSETREVWTIPAQAPTSAGRCVQPRIPGLRYTVEHQGEHFWLLTNLALDAAGAQTKNAPNQRLMRAPIDASGHEAWEEVVAHRTGVQLVDVDAFASHLVVTEREAGQRQIQVRPADGRAPHHVALPEPVCTIGLGPNAEYDSATIRIDYESLTTPSTAFAYEPEVRTLEKLRQVPVPGYDPSLYTTKRRTATAPDGTEVPMSVVHRKDLPIGPDTPLFLYGYGSYGITIEPRFANSRVSLLDRGIAMVIAHVRGGGYLGRPWYEAGKYQGKQNSFSDFIACGRSLHASGFSSPDHTVIGGGSAGGLLMGAVLNQAPDLCKGAVAWVPFVDVVTTMLDESIPLTAGEWEEWGDPRKPDPFQWMLAYSPYDNVTAQAYPNILIVAGLNDPRVQYWEPAKWVAKLRDTATGGDFLLLTHMGAGHAGRSGRYGHLEDSAHDYGWIIDQLQGDAAS